MDPMDRVAALRRKIEIERMSPSLAVAVATEAFGEISGQEPLTRWAHAAQLFCIFCAFTIPVGFFWAFTM